MRPRRLLRGLMLTLAATVLLPPAVIVLALVALDSDRGRAFARGQIAELLTGSLEGRVEIASVVDLTPDRIALEGLSLGDGDAPLEFDRVVLDLRLAQILPPRLHLELSLDGFRSTVSRSGDGTWEVGGWKSTGEGESPSVPRWIAELDVLARGGELKVTGVGNEALLFEGLSLDARLWVGLLGGMALELQRLETDLGRESRLSLTGAMDLGEGGTIHGRLLFDPLWVGDLGDAAAPLLPGTRLLGHLSLDGTLDEPRIEGDLRSGDAHLTGDLRWQASGPDAQRRVELTLDARGVDLRALVADGPETWLNGRAELEARSGPGGFGSPSGWVRLEESSAFGFDLAGVGFELEAEDRATSFDLRASTPGEGLSFEARGTIDAGAGYRSSLQGGLWLRSPQGLPAGWDSYLHGSDLRLEVEADLEDPFGALPTAALEVGIGPGRLRGLPIDGGGLRGSLTPGRLELDRLWLRADRSDLVGEGTIRSAGGDRPAEIEAALRGPLSLGLLTDVYGVLRTDARIWGPVDAPSVSATLESEGEIDAGIFYGEISGRLEGESLGAPGSGASLSLEGLLSPVGFPAQLFGRDERPARLEARWRSDAGPTDNISLALEFGGEGPGLSLEARAEVADETRVVVPRFDFRPVVGDPGRLIEPVRMQIEETGLRVEAMRFVLGQANLEAGGELAGFGGPKNDFDLRLEGVDLERWCAMLQPDHVCAGSLAADLRVGGPAADPEVGLGLRTADLAVDDQPYGRLVLKALGRSGWIDLDAELDGPGGELDLEGRLPLDVGLRAPRLGLDRPVRLEVRADDFQIDALRAFASHTLRSLDGRATIGLDWKGTLADPLFSGRIAVDDLAVSLAAAGARHRDGRVRIEVEPRRVRIREFSLDQQAITAMGEIRLERGWPADFDLGLNLRDATLVRRPDATVAADGVLALAGPLEGLRISGDVTIGPATLRPSVAPGSRSPEEDPSIRVVRRFDPEPAWVSGIPPQFGAQSLEAGRPPKDPVPSSGIWKNASIEVEVRLDDRVAVQRFDASLRLGGAIAVNKVPGGAVEVQGEIAGRRGWYVFQGRRFDIDRAIAVFPGGADLDPRLDVEARYRAPDYRVSIRITGTASRPSLDLSSDPPLGQSDILAVILFGTPASQLDDSQGRVLQSQALALLASYVAPDLQSSILDSFGLTSLTFSMPGGNTAGTIGVGRYFGDDLFVSFARDFGGPSGGTSRQLQGLVGSSVTIQYSISPSLTLQGASSTEGESSIDLFWRRRY
jgi:hypothetical protein